MRIAPILARLQAQCTTLLVVLPTQALNTPADIELATPACYLHVSEEIPVPSTLDRYTSQRVEIRLAVIVVAGSYDEDTAEEPLEDVRADIQAALLGWEPSAEYEPLQHTAGAVVQITGSLIWWRDIWSTALLRRQV